MAGICSVFAFDGRPLIQRLIFIEIGPGHQNRPPMAIKTGHPSPKSKSFSQTVSSYPSFLDPPSARACSEKCLHYSQIALTQLPLKKNLTLLTVQAFLRTSCQWQVEVINTNLNLKAYLQ